MLLTHAGIQNVKETYLPFWATSARVRTLLRSAAAGFDSWQQVYNRATRRWEYQLVTDWRTVTFNTVRATASCVSVYLSELEDSGGFWRASEVESSFDEGCRGLWCRAARLPAADRWQA